MYEISFILREENIAPVRSVFSKRGVEFPDGVELRKVRLAYPINKNEYGFFGDFEFTTSPEELEKVFADLKLEEGIFRYMVTKTSEKKSRNKEPRKTAESTVNPSKKSEDSKSRPEPVLTNEELEKKIEEILQ